MVAGHLPILHYRAKSNSVQQLLIKQIPLTVKPGYRFKTNTTEFAQGDIFLFMTDGLVEVTDSRNREYGIERIEALLQQNANLEPSDLFTLIIDDVRGHGPQNDDQTLLIVRCR